jgi:hypothetical protein
MRDVSQSRSAVSSEKEPRLQGETKEANRRAPAERRKRSIPVAVERRSGKERRDKEDEGERRRQVDPTTCEKDYSDDEIQFMKAMDQYKRANKRPFPTWSEVLEVLRSLGYRKTEEPTPMPGMPIPPKG